MEHHNDLPTRVQDLHRLLIHLQLDLKRAGLPHHAERIAWAEENIARVRTWLEFGVDEDDIHLLDVTTKDTKLYDDDDPARPRDKDDWGDKDAF